MRVDTGYGFPLDVPVGDKMLIWSVFRGMLFEGTVARALERTLKSGDIVVDGGAHVGLFTTLASRHVGSHGKVAAFEPNPGNARFLRRNVALNQLEALIVVEQAALADQSGVRDFQWSPSLTTHGSLLGLDRPDTRTESVRTVALDDYLGTKLGRVDVIKLDLEGGEACALEGMHKSLRLVRCLIFEVNVPRLRSQGLVPQELVARAMEVGAFGSGRILPIDGGESLPLDELGDELDRCEWSNVMLER